MILKKIGLSNFYQPVPFCVILQIIIFSLFNQIPAIQVPKILTPEEQTWLKKNKDSIRYAVPNYPPYDFLNGKGDPAGLVADQMALLKKYTGINFQIIKAQTWNDIIKMAENGQIDLFSSVTPTQERKSFLEFSSPLFEVEAVVIIRADASRYASVEEMCGKIIGVGKGYITTTLFSNQFPCITLREFSDDDAGLKAVAFGEIDGFLSDLGTATWLIRKRQLNNLRLGSKILYRIPNCIAIRNDQPVLVSIINKGLSAITPEERDHIRNRWIGNLERPPMTFLSYLKIALPFVIPVVVLLVVSLFWAWFLRKTVALRTRELTERSKQLAEHEQFYREIFNSTSDAVFIHDEKGRIIDTNDRVCRMFDYTREKILTLTVADISSGESPFSTMEVSEKFRLLSEEGPQIFEWMCKKSTKELFWAEIALKSCSILGEKRVIASVRDIHERKITEKTLRENNERLRQSEKMEAIGQLAGGVAHDFNNMLTGIIASAEILENYLTDDTAAHKYLSLINNSADRAADLARNLLTFARRNIMLREPVDVHTCVQDVISILENTIDKRIVISTDFRAKHSFVEGDKSQIQSAFLNLGINASHAMPDGGTLQYNSRLVHLHNEDFRVHTFKLTEGDYIEISIIDTGNGISPEDLPRIFEPFFTTKGLGKGSGLGLAGAYGMVKQHNGAITVHSIVGKGTEFVILLPVTTKTGSEKPPLTGLTSGKGLILVVDDEESIRSTSQIMLTKLGYSVLLATNGLQGLEMFTKHKDSVSLVILDQMMPEMNGRDCFFALKKIRSDIRVILASGFSQEEDILEMKTAGLTGFIHKPFRWSEFSKLINDMLQK